MSYQEFQKAGERLNSSFWNKSFINYYSRKDYSIGKLDWFGGDQDRSVYCSGDNFLIIQIFSPTADGIKERIKIGDIFDEDGTGKMFETEEFPVFTKFMNNKTYTIYATEVRMLESHSDILNLENMYLVSGESKVWGWGLFISKNSRAVGMAYAVENETAVLIQGMNDVLGATEKAKASHSTDSPTSHVATFPNPVSGEIIIAYDTGVNIAFYHLGDKVEHNGNTVPPDTRVNLVKYITKGSLDYYKILAKNVRHLSIWPVFSVGASISTKRFIFLQDGKSYHSNYQYPLSFPITNGILNKFYNFTNLDYYIAPISEDVAFNGNGDGEINTTNYNISITGILPEKFKEY